MSDEQPLLDAQPQYPISNAPSGNDRGFAPGAPLPGGCKLPEAGCPVGPFLVALLLFILWVCLLLPITLIWQLCKLLVKPCCPKAKAEATPAFQSQADTEAAGAQRQFDIVLLGATGFTGFLAAKYMAKQYGGNVTWAIAGRSQAKLESVRDKLSSISPAMKELPIILANSNSEDKLRAMVASTRVVISTVGPFARYGSLLVATCASLGTHYADITGEIAWVREMIDRHDDTARATGARLVHCCGHDCVPWDLLTMVLAEGLQQAGDELCRVAMYDEIKSAPSGGTIETLFNSLEAKAVHKAALEFDPLLKRVDGSKGLNLQSDLRSCLGYSSEFGAWCGPFVMALCNVNAVRRSNAVLKYTSQKMRYHECKVYPGFMAGFIDLIRNMYFGTAFMLPPLSWAARKILPAPGEGPSEESMDTGFLKVTGFAHGANGKKGKATIWFPTDPGYRDTARMLVESGLALALDSDDVPTSGGVWMPACGLGKVLLNRLLSTGSQVHNFELY